MKHATLASGIELDYLDIGPLGGQRDAPVLIFLHGFPESHRTWRHQISHFSRHFRCIAPDQRGYRGSSKPQEISAYSPDKLAGDVFQLADALGIGEFTVVGHDWGGAIAWIVAALGQGSRVSRAVIANAPHPAIFQRLVWTDPVQRKASQYMRIFRDTANDALVQEHGLIGMLAKAFDPKLLSGDMEPAERDALLTDWQDREAAFGMLNWYRAGLLEVPPLDAPYELPEGWTPPALPLLTIPTLVIWAMDDVALPPCNLVGLEAIVRDLTLVKVPDCGHFVTWQAPDAVNAAMDLFLARG
jgi:pimeloyl-ACP methyl ester carboxylesterase